MRPGGWARAVSPDQPLGRAGDRLRGTRVDGPDPAGALALTVEDPAELFETLDPAPRHERDLDARTEAFLIASAEDLPPTIPLCLTVHLRGPVSEPEAAQTIRDAIRHHFTALAAQQHRQFLALMRQGRWSLVVGIGFLSICVLAGNAMADLFAGADILRETLLIGGWVAMWQPLQIYLYDWWPVVQRERLFRRMAAMRVHLQSSAGPS